jgi:hypothetical protein
MKKAQKAQLCASCNTLGGGLKHCARCQITHYCNRACQQAHWKEHKPDCRVWSKEQSRKISDKLDSMSLSALDGKATLDNLELATTNVSRLKHRTTLDLTAPTFHLATTRMENARFASRRFRTLFPLVLGNQATSSAVDV